MNTQLLKEKTGTTHLRFWQAEQSTSQWNDGFFVDSIVIEYKSMLNEMVSLHLSTFNYVDVEIRPLCPYLTERLRVEVSKVTKQIIELLHENMLFSTAIDPSILQVTYSDLLIHDFDTYEHRQSMMYLFPHKKGILETYKYLNSTLSDEASYESKRNLVLVGQDGRELAQFLANMNIIDINYVQDALLTVISFKNEAIHYQFHIHYLKQMFEELGYTCHFLDNSKCQHMLHKDVFLENGGKYDSHNHFFI